MRRYLPNRQIDGRETAPLSPETLELLYSSCHIVFALTPHVPRLKYMIMSRYAHDTHNHAAHAAHDGYTGHDHSQMVADFRKRFWTSLLLTFPVLALSPMIQHALGLGENWRFSGDAYVLTALSSIIYFYGGWPFLDGLRQELRARNPGMMTLVGVAITAAYIYSVATLIGLAGNDFFWELVTLIDIMLLGHWIEMKSVMGAGKALEKLAALIPDTAHLLNSDGSTQEIAVSTLKGGEHLLVKPGEKIPADAIIIKGQTSANESMLTGESIPVPKQEGDTVIGGAINGEGATLLYIIGIRHTSCCPALTPTCASSGNRASGSMSANCWPRTATKSRRR